MRIAIVGSRNYLNLNLVKLLTDKLPQDSVIVSGGAKGVDLTAETCAQERGLKTLIFKPDWKLGKAAGMIRNRDIINNAEVVVAFWDGHSSGTKNSIDLADSLRIPCYIVKNEHDLEVAVQYIIDCTGE